MDINNFSAWIQYLNKPPVLIAFVVLVVIAAIVAVLTGMKYTSQKSSGDNSHNINVSGKNANVNINIPDKNDETKGK